MKLHPRYFIYLLVFFSSVLLSPSSSPAWHDGTHLAIAKAGGYKKWYNAAAADVSKLKAGYKEKHNHYVNNKPDVIITPDMVVRQAKKYNKWDLDGHLYGAIIASIRNYLEETEKGKYSEYHLAYCVHYIGDLSQPLHNTQYNDYNRKNHAVTDGIINAEVLENQNKIRIYPIKITSERQLASEIARIANISLKLGNKIEKENRLLKKNEAYQQISHSASLLKAVLAYINTQKQ